MERQKAVIASALLAGSLMTGGLAYAITGGALDSRQDNVGKLQPTTSAAITVPVDRVDATPAANPSPVSPATSAPAIAAAPQTTVPTTVSKASPTGGSSYEQDEHEQDEYEGHEYESDGDDD